MLEALEPLALKAFALSLQLLVPPAMAIALYYARKWLRDKAGVQGLIAMEIGERLLKKELRKAILHTEEYAYALQDDKISPPGSVGKLAMAADYAFELIRDSKLPSMSRDKVEELVIAELGLMREDGMLTRNDLLSHLRKDGK